MISSNIYVPYPIILKVIMFVHERATFFTQNLLVSDIAYALKWSISRKKWPKKVDFYVHLNWTDSRCRSISKLVRYYLQNMGNFYSLFEIYSFDSFWFIMFSIFFNKVYFFYVILHRNIACWHRSTTKNTWYNLDHNIAVILPFVLEVSTIYIKIKK